VRTNDRELVRLEKERKVKIPRKNKISRPVKNSHGPKIKTVAPLSSAQLAEIEAAKNLTAFACYKKSDTCVLLGSGPSICDISEKEWEVIHGFDSCALNNWVYHPTFVPNFYFIEVKWYNYDLIQRRLKEKFELYKDVIFFFPKGKGIRNPHTNVTVPLKDVAKGFPTRIEYNLVSRDRKRTHAIWTADYKIVPSKFTKSYDVSITNIFEFLFRMGYKKIILYGVDLTSSYYFWTGGDPKYGEVHHQWNKQHEDKDPKLPHATYKIQDFIVDFNSRWMKPEGREIMVGHKTTALYPYLRYVDVKEL
jgi:hypothetical protein